MKIKENILETSSSPYGKLMVTEGFFRDDPVRFLLVNGNMESAMYLEEERKYDLVFPYMRYFNYALAVRPDLKNTLLIGGGAFSYPKYYVHAYPDKNIDAIEISEDIISLARSYFEVEEMQKEAGNRMKILNMNGAEYLSANSRKYDFIINDAFIGNKPFGMDEDTIDLFRANMNENGVYAVNCVSAAKGPFAWRGQKLMKRLKKKFAHTMMILCDDEFDLFSRQNIVFFASDKELDLYPENTEE